MKKEYSYDDLLSIGYKIIGWTDSRLAAVSPKNQYEIFGKTKNDLWVLLSREHSNYNLI